MKKSKKSSSNRAITLMALIITVIVMLVLVAVSVSILVESDLIGAAEKAGDKFNSEQEKDQTLGKVTIGGTEYNSIEEYIKPQECNHEFGTAEITKVADCIETGIQKKTCTKCGYAEEEIIAKTQDHTIEYGICTKCGKIDGIIKGATIAGYDPSVGASGSINTSYTSEGAKSGGSENADGTSGNGYDNQTFTVKSITEWQVLGEENGQVIITPTTQIETDKNAKYYLNGQAGYENMIEELDKISSIYGQGKYADTSKYSVIVGNETIASGGRSIKIEDIATLDSTPKTKKTYSKNADDEYIYCDGTKTSHKTFIYWGEDALPNQGAEWKELGSGDSVTIASYGYGQPTRTDLEKEMVFGNVNDGYKNYWLASRYADPLNTGVGLYNELVYYGSIGSSIVFFSSCAAAEWYSGVRPVVYLESDIRLNYNPETGVYTIIP